MRKFGKHFWDNKTFATSTDSDHGRYNFTQTVLYGGKMSPGTTLRIRVTSHNFA